MKMKVVVALIIIFAIVLYPVGAIAEREEGKTYSRLAVVVGWEKVGDEWLVTCQDREGNLWSFYDDERYWKICDFCNLLMFAYDDDFTHDEILDVTYEGFLTPSACALWLTL